MNKYLEQLIELSKLDKQIDDFEPRIAQVEKKLKLSQEKEKEFKAQTDAFAADIADAKLKKAKNEAHLAELSAKLKDLGKKSALVKILPMKRLRDWIRLLSLKSKTLLKLARNSL